MRIECANGDDEWNPVGYANIHKGVSCDENCV